MAPTHEQVLEHVDVAVVVFDADRIVCGWNSGAEALYGWTREEALGRPLRELTRTTVQDGDGRAAAAAFERGEPWQGTLRLRRKDGSTAVAFVKGTPILDDEQRLVGVVGAAIELGDAELARAVRALATSSSTLPGRRMRSLSPREREVLGLLARGLTGEQIAERLVLSRETVRTHIRNAREKLGASTRVEAVTMALLAREIEL